MKFYKVEDSHDRRTSGTYKSRGEANEDARRRMGECTTEESITITEYDVDFPMTKTRFCCVLDGVGWAKSVRTIFTAPGIRTVAEVGSPPDLEQT